MKKILLLLSIAALFITSCSKDNSNSQQLKQKLIGEWINYGSYHLKKQSFYEDSGVDTTYRDYNRPNYWTFYENDIVNITDKITGNPDYDFWIENDVLFTKSKGNSPGTTKRQIKFAGDSCILTTAEWANSYNKAILVLYPLAKAPR